MFLGTGSSTVGWAICGGLVGLGRVAPAITTTFLFERRPRRSLAIDAGYHIVTFVVMGSILGAFL